MKNKEIYLVYGLDYVAEFREDIMFGGPSFTRAFAERKDAIDFFKEKCLECFLDLKE